MINFNTEKNLEIKVIYKLAMSNMFTFGVSRKYCEADLLQTVFTTNSNTFLSLCGSMPCKMLQN
jgi:hypothetical protein